MKLTSTFKLSIAFFALCVLFTASSCNSPANTEQSDVIAVDTTTIADMPIDTSSTDIGKDDTASKTVGVADTTKKPTRRPLMLVIRNLESATGPIYVSFYNASNKFTSKTDRMKEYKFIPHGKMLTVPIKDLDYGELALATYQDVNDDGECNTNMVGIPKEPYGFSNDYRPKVRAPKFEECKFEYSAKQNKVILSMIR